MSFRYRKKKEARKDRAYNDGIYLIEMMDDDEDEDETPEKKFAVMGSTGNVYTVTISNEPSCTCLDYRINDRRCKHIFFILMRVMKVIDEDQPFYTDEELKEMFENIPSVTRNLMVKRKYKKKYKKLAEEASNDEEEKTENKPADEGNEKTEHTVKRKELNDICPICLDDINNGKEVDYCKEGCGNNIHVECFRMWAKKNNAICVFCRAKWVYSTKKRKASKKKKRGRGYMNLFK